jgi:hypothetical protein
MNRGLPALAPFFVWSVWLIILTAMLGLAVSYTVNIPWADEWDYASVLGGARPISFALLWEQHNEHRVPLPKLIWFLSLRLSHYNFRALSFFHILAFAGLSAGLVVYAKFVRGWTAYSDAFFPLLVLNPAHYQNLLWAWQIAFILPVLLIGVLLLVIVRTIVRDNSFTWKSIVIASACLILLPLCGAVGLVFGPVLSLWVGYVALSHWESPERLSRHKRLLLLAAVCIVILLAVLYLHGLEKPQQIPPTPGFAASLRASLEFLSGSFGFHAGLAWPSIGLAMLILILASAAIVLTAVVRQTQARLSSIGFLLFLGAGCLLALSIGVGRAGFGVGAGLQPRYVTLALPALLCVYFVWLAYTPLAVSRVIQIVLFAVVLMLLPISVREALAFRQLRLQQAEAFRTDLQSGMAATALVQRHATTLLDHFADSPDEGARALGMLQKAGMETFRALDSTSIPTKPTLLGGSLDVANADQIGGWAWDQEHPNTSIKVTIVDGEKVLATVDAVRFRQDLVEARIGLGDHAFTYLPPADLADGKAHKIRALVAGTELPGSPKDLISVTEANFLASPSPATSVGSLDVVNEDQIGGWAWDRAQPDKHVQVEIRDRGTVLSTVGAVQFRHDLFDAGIGRGDHAFVYPMPPGLKDGKPHMVTVMVVGASVELPGSPKSFIAKR